MENQAQRVTGGEFVAEMDINLRSSESSPFIPLTGAFFPFPCHNLGFVQVGMLRSTASGDGLCRDLCARAVVRPLKLKDKKWG